MGDFLLISPMSSCVLDVSVDYLILRGLLIQRLNQHVQSVIHIIYWIHVLLPVNCSQQHLGSILDIAQVLQVIILSLNGMLMTEWRGY
jgi:hypothetical protein